jgi:type II secretory pathway component PulJ
LIEMVLAIGAVAIVLGMCAGLLHVLLRLDRTGRDHMDEMATVGRLARQFRRDVHAADEAKAVGDGGSSSKLELILPDDCTVVYEGSARALARTERHGAVVARRETYRLPSDRKTLFLVQPVAGKVWVSLRLQRGSEIPKPNGFRGLHHDLQIDAVAGKEKALVQPRPKNEETGP